MFLILIILFIFSNIYAIHGEDSDLSDRQWYYLEENGVHFPDWNEYNDESQPIRNIDKVNGENVVVAVLDTGIDYNHEDLKNVMWTGGDIDELKEFGGSVYGYDAVGETVDGVLRHDDPRDRQGHGTHVAGIIAAEWNHTGISGALSGVKIMAVRTSQNGNIDYVKAGMEYVLAARKAGVNVAAINLSWNGGIRNSTPEILYNTIKELTENGVTICISSGNENTDLNQKSSVSSFFRSIPGVIIVGATDKNRNLAKFSNYGSHYCDILTPGESILSTYFDPDNIDENGNPRHDLYMEMDGTSMSAPIATAASALLYSLNPELSAARRAARIIETAYFDYKHGSKGGFLNINGFLDDANSSAYVYSGEYNGEVVSIHGFDLGTEGILEIDDCQYNTFQWSDTLISLYMDDLEPGEHFITVTSENNTRSYWINIVVNTAETEKLDSTILEDKVITSMAVDDRKMFIAADDKYLPKKKILIEYDLDSGTSRSYIHDSLGSFNTIVSNNGILYYFDTFTENLYCTDPKEGIDTMLAKLAVTEGYTINHSLFCIENEIYIAYKHENWPDSKYCISRLTDGSFEHIISIEDDIFRICDLYRKDDELILLASVLSVDPPGREFNAYRIEDGKAFKLPFAVTVEDYNCEPSARGFGNTVIISPVENTWTSVYGDNSDCFSYSIDQYDLRDSRMIKSTVIGGGHLSVLSRSAGQVFGDHFYLSGSADAMPHNSFIYRISPVQQYEISLIKVEGGTIDADHQMAQPGELVTLYAAADDHHTFNGWIVTDSEGTAVEVTDDQFVMPDDNVTVSSIFSIRKCTVSFDSNEGSGEMRPVQADIDTLFTLPECTFTAPDEDMLFDCWIAIFKGKEGMEMKAKDTVVLSDDLVLKAKWKDFEYEFIGETKRWILNRDGSLDFIFKRTVNDYKTFDYFINYGRLEIDGEELKSYKASKGSLIITLDASYLNTLSAGVHNMQVFFKDGSCSTAFIVEKQTYSYTVPVTGIN